MDTNELKTVLELHAKWRGEDGGKRADLQRANLRGADLQRANLRGANLQGADLQRANLRGADLQDANLQDANLRGADLQRANLRGADLQYANLQYANLQDANLQDANLPHFQIVPEVGAFVGFKKLANGVICIVEIPAEAKRTSSLVGRKCRAEFVKVLEGEGVSHTADSKLEYRVGEIVRADSFDDDIRIECTHGIHFFITRKEAEEYA